LHPHGTGTSQDIHVVGNAEKRNLDIHAFVWIKGEMYDLNGRITEDGWELGSAEDINGSGQIAGNGTIGSRKNRQSHAYLLTLALP
jgi:probable HAF family extracellular repeat protein